MDGQAHKILTFQGPPPSQGRGQCRFWLGLVKSIGSGYTDFQNREGGLEKHFILL